MNKPCCHQYEDGIFPDKCVVTALGQGVEHYPGNSCDEVKTSTNGCCVSFGYGDFMVPCCHTYEDDVADSSCVVSTDVIGGGSKMHFPDQRCTEVKAGCCVTFGYGSMMKPCCHQYEDGIFPDKCVVTALGQGVKHYPGDSCDEVKESTNNTYSICQDRRMMQENQCDGKTECPIVYCLDDGSFRPWQCKGDVCYCVNEDGNKIFGSHYLLGESMNCSSYQSPCQIKREQEIKDCDGKVGCLIPTCAPDGAFTSKQCHGSTGFCWCVDSNGTQVGSQTRESLSCQSGCCMTFGYGVRMQECCHEYEDDVIENSCTAPALGGGALHYPGSKCEEIKDVTLCEKKRHLDKSVCGEMLGCFVTQCTNDGDFSTQVLSSTGFSWCVNGKGEKIVSTESRAEKTCDACKKKQTEDAVKCLGLGCYETQCEANCCFKSRQCFGSVCWCVDSKGKKLNGTHHHISKIRGCEQKTPCELQSSAQCEPDGSFSPKQCIGDECWCTTMEGEKIPGNFENCECIRQRANEIAKCNGMYGCFEHQCENDGSFSPQQCEGSVCWCVKSNGKKLGIYGSIGEINCRRASCKDEKESREELMCEEDGSYTPKQCNAEKCWCTTVNGEYITGTNSPLGHYLNCACLRQRSKDMEKCSGYGCFITQCEADGSFVSKQCLGSVCWCVNSYGQKLLLKGARNLSCSTSCLRRQASDIVSCGDKLGCRIAKCDYDGSFSPLQCFEGYCSCFTPDGNEIQGSKFEGWDFKSCECTVQQSIDKANCGGYGCKETKCEADGSFSPLQCLGSNCSCVNAAGKELSIAGDRTLVCDLKNCKKREYEDKRVCDGRLGCFKTQCEKDGSFKPVQCFEGVCWCVCDGGYEIKGTKVTSPALPNCGCVRKQIRDKQKCMSPKSIEKYLDPKEKEETDMYSKEKGETDMYSKEKKETDMDSKKYMGLSYPLGCFISKCNWDGSFLSRQCHGSKCWCVDNHGIPIQNTIKNISNVFKCPTQVSPTQGVSPPTQGVSPPNQGVPSAASNIYLNIVQLISLPNLLFFLF